MIAQISLMKPGMASFFMPRSGTHQAWMTSSAVSRKRTLVSVGSTISLSTSLQVVLDGERVVVDGVAAAVGEIAVELDVVPMYS